LNLSIETIANGPWKQNCYVVTDSDTKKSFIVDPGSEGEKIQKHIDDGGLEPVAIVNTHGHFDHVGAVDFLMKTYGIPFYLSCDDVQLLKQANIYRLLFETKEAITVPKVTNPLDPQNHRLSIGPFDISVILTPGHTKGSVCLIVEGEIFGGDTIFSKQIGRTDLPGGDSGALQESVCTLRQLPGSLNVWPGHGRPFLLENLWKSLDVEFDL
jgi:glyoxylase-like metal-dependent hydrolase (beta-lactamase superfamily II)